MPTQPKTFGRFLRGACWDGDEILVDLHAVLILRHHVQPDPPHAEYTELELTSGKSAILYTPAYTTIARRWRVERTKVHASR